MIVSDPPRMPLGAVYATTLLLQIVMNGSRPMVSYRALDLGADDFDLGVIAASFAGLSALAAVPVGGAIVRYGARRFIVAACVVAALSCVGLALSGSLALVMIVQAVLGLALVMGLIGFQTLVANAGSDAGSDGRFGVFTATVSLGQLFGPILAGGIATAAAASGWYAGTDERATTAVFVALAVVSVVAVPVSLAIRERPATPSNRRPVAGHEVVSTLRAKGMPQALFSSVVLLCTVDLLSVYLPAWGDERGWSVGTVSALIAVRAAGSFVVRLFLQPVIDRFGRRKPLGIGCAIGALALIAIPVTSEIWLAFALLTIVGVVLGMGQPMTMSWVSRVVPVRLRPTALAIRMGGNRLGQLIVPVGIGTIAGAAGTAMIFVVLGGLLLAATGAVAASRIDDVA